MGMEKVVKAVAEAEVEAVAMAKKKVRANMGRLDLGGKANMGRLEDKDSTTNTEVKANMGNKVLTRTRF